MFGKISSGKWFILIPAFVSLAVIVVVPVVILAGVYLYYQTFGLIYPGVRVGDTRLAGKTIQEAVLELHIRWNTEHKIAASDGIHQWTVTPAEIGISLDALETIKKAHTYGHSGSLLGKVAQLLYGMKNGVEITPIINYDPVMAQRKLEELNQQATQPAQDASLRFENGELMAVPAQLGYTFNLEDTLNLMAGDPGEVLKSGRLHIALKPIPPQVVDVSAAMADARRLLDRPVIIHAYDPVADEHREWAIPREILGTWITIESQPQGPSLSLDLSRTNEYLTDLKVELGPGRYLGTVENTLDLESDNPERLVVNVTVRHEPTTYTVQPGDTLLKIGWNLGIPFWMILQANPGLDPDYLQAGQVLNIPSKDELLPLPVIPGKRVLISISRQRLSIFQNGELLSRHAISTGVDRSPTQPGVFQVQTHEKKAYASVWDLTMPNFLGIYEAWPGFMNGIHGLPTLSNGRRLWANILGKPASYGCIILDLSTAEWLYNWAEDGVIVEIQP